MDAATLRTWLVFLHVVSVLGFIAVHGISAGVTFKVRGERDRQRIAAYLELSNTYLNVMYVFLVGILLTGIAAGIVGGWWTSGRLWIWAALVTFVVVALAMYITPTPHFDALRHAVGLQTYNDRRKGIAAPPPASDEEIGRLLASSRPLVGAIVGIIGILILAWLMMLKPF
jgi:hypothetical protein